MPPALSSGSVEQGRISRETHEEEKRERILAAMTAVFAKRGYQAATVDHLIAGAKISMGGFYKYFEGKEDCFVQAYDRVVDQVRERILLAVAPDADWPRQAATGTRTVIDFAVGKPMAAKIVLLEAQTGGAKALQRYGATLREVSAFLRSGRDEGNVGAKLPEGFEDATASGLVWLLQSRLARGELGAAEELYPQVAKVVLEPYLGPERAERVLRAASDEHAASR